MQQVRYSDRHHVEVNHGLTAEEVASRVHDIAKRNASGLSGFQRLRLDEIALQKGQGRSVVMFVDLDQRLLIGLAPSRQYENIQKVLEGWGQAVLNQITEVSIDLSGNYRGLARKQMPKAQVVTDRLHVAPLVNRELSQVRNQAIKSINLHLDELEQGEERDITAAEQVQVVQNERA